MNRRRVLVVGLGRIGERHARNAAALGHEVATVSRRGGGDFDALEAAERWAPDAVVVANEPAAHVPTALWALERGADVLLEKPLARADDEVEALLAASAGRTVSVGFNLRFHPALETVRDAVGDGSVGTLRSARVEAGQHLGAWYPGRDHRASSAARDGALLALNHELDYACWIAGDARVRAAATARGAALGLAAPDVAEVVLEHVGGALTSVHVDLLDRAYNRRARWVGEEATLSWTYGGPVVLERDEGATELWRDERFDIEETYRAELLDFFAACEDGREPRATLGDGVRALRLALEAAR